MFNSADFLEYKKCNICGNAEYKILYSWPKDLYSHDDYETCSWDGRESVPLKIVRCKKCGLVFTNPSFKEEYLYKIYPEDLIERIDDIEKHLDKFFDVNKVKFNNILKIIKKYKKSGTLLDIGTRYGGLPFVANKKYGYNSFGIEYNKNSVQLGKQRFENIFQGTIESLPKIKNTLGIDNVDIVIMDDVLEHLVNPSRDLEIIANYQKKGALLVLRQMDYNSIGRVLYGKNWAYFSHAHMYYFDVISIKKLLEKRGYSILKINKTSIVRNGFFIFKKTIRRIKNKNSNIFNVGKNLYIKKRKKSFDDMFLVVAKKRI